MVASFPPILPTPKAMTIAGSDSGGGAGIQADLKTFAALGVYGSSALTAVTAQNTLTVLAIAEVPDEVIALQIDGIMEDIGADAIKTGMLSSAGIIDVIVDRLEAWGSAKLVVDPVMVAKSGETLLQSTAIRALATKLLPLALIATPNFPEAEVLSRRDIVSDDDLRYAAAAIHALGPRYVVIKGGHRGGPPVDLVFDGGSFMEVGGIRVATTNTHGTGCTFSAAIAAFLARGLEPLAAIEAAKRYVLGALEASYSIGSGHSPVNHFFDLQTKDRSADGREQERHDAAIR